LFPAGTGKGDGKRPGCSEGFWTARGVGTRAAKAAGKCAGQPKTTKSKEPPHLTALEEGSGAIDIAEHCFCHKVGGAPKILTTWVQKCGGFQGEQSNRVLGGPSAD